MAKYPAHMPVMRTWIIWQSLLKYKVILLVFTAILNQKYDPHFPLQHQQKDLRLALQLGDKVEQPLYIAAAANEVCVFPFYL